MHFSAEGRRDADESSIVLRKARSSSAAVAYLYSGLKNRWVSFQTKSSSIAVRFTLEGRCGTSRRLISLFGCSASSEAPFSMQLLDKKSHATTRQVSSCP